MKAKDLEGKKASEFELPNQDGKVHKLSDYNGKWVILYFYPRDDTPGCTVEACSFRDNTKELKKAGAVVLGVSKDPVKSHRKFADKFQLEFPLLADESKETIKAYGAWGLKKFMGRESEGTLRTTFLINPKGDVEKVYEGVKPADHALEILKDIRSVASD